MKKQFVISDTHFGHANILTFLDDKGDKIRPFSNVDEMDETMVENWNSVVNDGDTVYHLGDVVINKKYLHILSRLKGRKILIKGNHDIFKLKDYTEHFEDIRAYKVLIRDNFKFILSHIPVYEAAFERWKGGNIHGHTHEKRVMTDKNTINPKYFSVSVEQINYTPILLDNAIERLISQ